MVMLPHYTEAQQEEVGRIYRKMAYAQLFANLVIGSYDFVSGTVRYVLFLLTNMLTVVLFGIPLKEESDDSEPDPVD